MEQDKHVSKKPKLLVVVGSTGVGKTKLGVALAKQFDGEVVSCDSMQIYKQVDIATNKVTSEEADGVMHHMINIIEPTDTSFNVSKFIAGARSVIDDILSRNKMPILVGGTHQYVEGLLVSNPYMTNPEQRTIEDSKTSEKAPLCTASELLEIIHKEPLNVDNIYERVKYEQHDHLLNLLEEMPHDQLFKTLSAIDPSRATKLHPNDYRKIIRSLHVFLTTGELHSKVLEREHLRSYDACILWPKAKLEVLGERLDQRIDQMVQRGIVAEVLMLRDLFEKHQVPIEFTKGVFQSIGYKEFAPYLEQTKGMSREEIARDERLVPVLAECLTQLKSNTRHYARKQTTWIKNRLASVTQTSIYCLDATDLINWGANVRNPAVNICKAFLNNSAIEWGKVLHSSEDEKQEWKKYECAPCNKILNGPHEWEVHVTSKSHHKRKASLKRREKNELKRHKPEEAGDK
jgi:tRNA dimethylallyltransferase